ncbi:MAG: DUF4251 domain-containing protein [Bacteroidales bacterium]|nr:DUF4251 domain-containing protein [Bacteroidales bacterium]
MKRIYYLFIMLSTIVLGSMPALAQNTDGGQTMTAKEARKAERAIRRKIVAEQNEKMFQTALQALKEQSFVVEVDQLIFPRGMTKFVSSTTNFVSVNDGNAVIQITTSNFNPGPNGIGGITLDGTPSNVTISTDKKGIVYYNFVDQGIAVSATVNVQMIPGSNRATVTIYPNFSNNVLTMTGTIVPYEDSTIYKGMAI